MTVPIRWREHANQVRQWRQLDAADGNVLLVVNSADDRQSEIATAIDALLGVASRNAIQVIASRQHAAMLTSAGISDQQILFAESASGAIEINHFLESADALAWVETRKCHVIAGSAPHNLHNEEIKSIFEERVALLIGDGVFVAHALPEPYLYVFDGPGLVNRFGRARKVNAYRERVRALLADLQQHWEREGRPTGSDSQTFTSEMQILERHLGRDLLQFDESSDVPLVNDGGHGGVPEQVSTYLTHLLESIRERDRRTEAISAELRGVLAYLELPLRRRIWLRIRRLISPGS